MVRGFASGLIALVVAMACVLVVSADRAADPTPVTMTEMAGTWAGDAQIVVSWTTEKSLRVRLAIGPDARVTGTVGDAVLRDGRFEANRTAIGRALHIKTDWIVRGALDGDVIKAEGIRREGVMIPLNWIDDHFEGGVNTSGSHFGGKGSMWLAAQQLRLERVKSPSTTVARAPSATR
jgi:hypothetical protein